MYCSKCGKEIDYESPVCLECTAMIAMQAREAKKQSDSVTVTANPQPAVTPTAPIENAVEEIPAVKKNTRKAGLGKAIIGNALSTASAFVLYFALIVVVLGLGESGGTLTLVFLAMNIVAFIFALQSIKTFRRARKNGDPAPIATLILGINGLYTAVTIVVIGLLYLIIFSLIGEGLDLDYNIFDYSYFNS